MKFMNSSFTTTPVGFQPSCVCVCVCTAFFPLLWLPTSYSLSLALNSHYRLQHTDKLLPHQTNTCFAEEEIGNDQPIKISSLSQGPRVQHGKDEGTNLPHHHLSQQTARCPKSPNVVHTSAST